MWSHGCRTPRVREKPQRSPFASTRGKQKCQTRRRRQPWWRITLPCGASTHTNRRLGPTGSNAVPGASTFVPVSYRRAPNAPATALIKQTKRGTPDAWGLGKHRPHMSSGAKYPNCLGRTRRSRSRSCFAQSKRVGCHGPHPRARSAGWLATCLPRLLPWGAAGLAWPRGDPVTARPPPCRVAAAAAACWNKEASH